jgi:hypothetical protein
MEEPQINEFIDRLAQLMETTGYSFHFRDIDTDTGSEMLTFLKDDEKININIDFETYGEEEN